MAREQAEATSKEDVLTALGARGVAAAREARRIAGVDPEVRRAAGPGDDLVARRPARLLARARRTAPPTPGSRRFRILQRAIELDPDFALAHGAAARSTPTPGSTSLAPEFAHKAFELRDRVSERERFFISFRYYRDAAQNWAEALELSQVVDGDVSARSVRLQQPGRGAQPLRPVRPGDRAARRGHPARPEVCGGLLQSGPALISRSTVWTRRAWCCSRLRRGRSRRSVPADGAICWRSRRAIRRRWRGLLDASVGLGQTNAAYGWQAHSFAFTGARARGARAVPSRHPDGVPGRVHRSRRTTGRRGRRDPRAGRPVRRGASRECRRPVVEPRQLHARTRQPGRSRSAAGTPKPQRCCASSRARFPGRDADARVSSSRSPTRPSRSAVANQRARSNCSSRCGRTTASPKTEFWPAYLRGQAYLQLKDGQAAAVEFQSILDHRGEYPNAPLYPLAHLGPARAPALAATSAKAGAAYDAFLGLWNGADRDLQPLVEAHRESARLR